MDNMTWAACVIVEDMNGTPVTIAGVSRGYFTGAEQDMSVILHTIRMLNPNANIIDSYYISREKGK